MLNMAFSDICRLCFSKNNLVWVFDKRFENSDSMRYVVFITTGVESETYSPNSLWTKWSMLKSKVNIHEKRDIAKFNELEAFLKRKSKSYKPKKSAVLSPNDVIRFLKNAPNEIHLLHKVVLIMGYFGGCRSQELLNMKISDIEDRDSVMINSTDAVSQKICETCCHITVNFFEFRKVSLSNDKLLKEKLKTATYKDDINREIPSAAVQIKQEPMDTTQEAPNDDTRLPIHSTISELFELHPHIKLPRICLTADVKPFVILPMDSVENYYKRRKLDFQEHCKLALKPRNTARKRTSVKTTNSPPCLINARIIPQQYEDEEKGLVQPIKLRIYPKSVHKENVTENESDSCRNTTEKITPCHRKRKMTDDESPTKENEKPEENCISPEPQEVSKSLSYVANVSVPLHMCNICDTVHYNYKDLKKHRLTHLRCQFCKVTFRSLETKNEHLESKCVIKNTINNFPVVEVPRIENDVDVVTKYSDVFGDHPSIQSNEVNSLKTVELNSDEEELPKPEPNQCATAENASEVIEIFSDDDDENNVTPVIPTKVPELPAIKPDVKLKNDTVTDFISPNLIKVLVLKNMLSSTALSSLSAEKEVQTEMPHEHNIEVNSENQTAELAHLKDNLQVFRVPVRIKNGPFQVSYNVSVDEPRTKNLRFWSDMTPVDIKVNNTGRTDFTQTESTTETIVPLTPSIGQTPTAQEQTIDINNTKVSSEDSPISNSCFDKPVNSTHNHISVVGLSTACTFPPRKKSVDPPTSATGARTSPPPASTNVTADHSEKFSVTPTSELAPVPAGQASTLPIPVHGSPIDSSPSDASTLSTDDSTVAFTTTSVPVSIDLRHLKQHLHVFRVPVEIQNGPFQLTYNISLDDPKTKNLRLWNDMTPVDIKVNNTGTVALARCNNRSNDTMTAMEQTKLTTETVVPLTSASALIPTTVAETSDACNTSKVSQNNSTSDSGSCFDKPVSSTHNNISILELLSSSPYPCSTNNFVSTTASSNITTDTSVNFSVAPTSVLSSVAASQESTSAGSSESHSSILNADNNALVNFPVVSTSTIVPVPIEQINTQHVYGSVEVSSANHTSSFTIENNLSLNVSAVPTSALVPAATGQNSTQLFYGSTVVSSANGTSAFNTNSQPMDMLLNRSNSVVTTSSSFPVIASKPLAPGKKPVSFKVPSIYKTKTHSRVSTQNVFRNNTRNRNVPSQAKDVLSTTATSVRETQLPRSSTAYYTKENQQLSTVNSAPRYVNSNYRYWPPPPYTSAPPPTSNAVGYSNVPVMVANSEGSCVPVSVNCNPGPLPVSTPTSAITSTNYFPNTPLGASYNCMRNSAPVNSASTYMSPANHTQLAENNIQNAAMQTAVTTCEGVRMSTGPPQGGYYSNPYVRETASDVLAVNSSTYSRPGSVRPSIIQYSAPAGNTQYWPLRVRDMKELT